MTGEISYEVNEDFNGPVAFSYTVADTAGVRSAAAAVSISVLPLNDEPDAVDDEGFTISGSSVLVPVLDNDTGIGDIPLSVLIEVQVPDPATGTCSVEGSSVRFTPGPGFFGTTQCSYRVTDSDFEFDVAVVTIYVNDPPDAADDFETIDEDVTVDIDVLANDSDSDQGLDTTTVTITDYPDHGDILGVNPATGEVTYRPDAGYHGTDSFRYTVDDLHVPAATSNAATVRITINSVNSDPVANDDTAYAQQDMPETIDVLANDFDPDLPPDDLTIVSVVDAGPPASTTIVDDHGTPGDPTDDSLLYTPDPGAWGVDTLTYTICDVGEDGILGTADDGCDSATVTVYLNGWPTAVGR